MVLRITTIATIMIIKNSNGNNSKVVIIITVIMGDINYNGDGDNVIMLENSNK